MTWNKEELALVRDEIDEILNSDTKWVDDTLRSNVLDVLNKWYDDMMNGDGPRMSDLTWIAAIAADAGLSIDYFFTEEDGSLLQLGAVFSALKNQIENASHPKVAHYGALISLWMHWGG